MFGWGTKKGFTAKHYPHDDGLEFKPAHTHPWLHSLSIEKGENGPKISLVFDAENLDRDENQVVSIKAKQQELEQLSRQMDIEGYDDSPDAYLAVIPAGPNSKIKSFLQQAGVPRDMCLAVGTTLERMWARQLS